MRARIERAREPQKARFAGRTGGPSGSVPLVCNAETPATALQVRVGLAEVREFCGLDTVGKNLLRSVLSAARGL